MKMATNSSATRRGGGSNGHPRDTEPVARRDAHGEIARRLRALYAEAEQEPLPLKLVDLLDLLDRAEEAAAGVAEGDEVDTASRDAPRS